MTSATNSPRGGATVLQLEARKAYALALSFLTPQDLPVDLTDCSIDFVMKPEAQDYNDTDDVANIITNSAAIIDDPTTGQARFSFQATDLDTAPGTYPFVINLTTAQGYPMVAVKGEVEILNNPSTGSLDEVYPDSLPVTTLDVILRNQQVMKIRMGNNVPPGYGYISVEDQGKLDRIISLVLGDDGELGTAAYHDYEEFATTARGIPAGGTPRSLLGKSSSADYATAWKNADSILPSGGIYMTVETVDDHTVLHFATADNPLDATDVEAGWTPTADGSGDWDWQPPPVLNADNIEDGVVNAMVTIAQRDKLDGIAEGAEANVNPDWDAVSGDAEILNKPDLSEYALVGHSHKLKDLTGFSKSDEDPTGGSVDDFHLKLVD